MAESDGSGDTSGDAALRVNAIISLLVDKGPADRDPLLGAATELLNVFVAAACQAKEFEHLAHSGPYVFAPEIADPQREGDVLENR